MNLVIRLGSRASGTFRKSKFALAAAMILAAASSAPAKVGGLPNLDLPMLCRASEKTIMALYSGITSNIFESCMNDEKKAREQLTMDWATYPAIDKARCAQPAQYLPSYTEWLTCFEMARQLKMIRAEQPAIAASVPSSPHQPGKRARTSNTDQCPIIKHQEDGSLIYMIAC